MRISQLNKMLIIEYAKLLVLILVGFILIDATYCYLFKSSNDLCLHWMCGTIDEPTSTAMIILKLLNISLIFLYIGNVCERFWDKFIIQVYCRISKRILFVLKFTLLLIFHSWILLLCSHYIFYCVSGDIPDAIDVCRYYLLDSLSFCGLVLIYIMMNNSCIRDWSLFCVMGILVINTVSPIPIPLAASTIKYIEMANNLGYDTLVFSNVVCEIFVIGFYAYVISKRRFSIC
ncbi:hypothetical protein [Butyrivibrio sp. MC2013]|uniref:hypothetical protein n=1 Tax=Butyrivibrio sp. MC2013 TaxID=1280686 RepID=UPI000402DF76|nr:hypothetical protein [Butyrivibrio sp. MC2013]